MSGRARLLAVARGDAEPDLVVAGARVFSAFTREGAAAAETLAAKPKPPR